ncbi:GntR family transcriptional regulator [Ramlibacter alkalitolerans]|uniref:GntR family transcriptional regulator n=1 Tax=Ramlibacter alkalitolerans TaxID=2039631 RepID=A0ABS1JUQ9_9BURK|nr:GntR family transcriptional regulator [Ramlibacter alkalitolerans]MBL0427983.1 GntR family transcriptional regulator [Ramlibacter alkalitolerans]
MSSPGSASRKTGHAPAAPAAPSAAVTLAQSVTEWLREAVLEGRFAPEEKLNEEWLSEMLAVSRTPVRSALHRLAAEGLLDYVPNRGFSMRGIDAQALQSVFDVRGVLEGLAARGAASHGLSAAQRSVFADALAAGDRLFAKSRLLPSGRTVFIDVNARIHETILEAAANRMLQDMLQLCRNVPGSSERNVPWGDYAWLRRSHDDHHRLFEAILLRDGERAEQLMREHVHTVKLKQIDGFAEDRIPSTRP